MAALPRPDEFIDLERLTAIAMRRVRLIAAFTALGVALGVAYLIVTPPVYTAATGILIDEDLTRYAAEEPTAPRQPNAEEAILSEVEILKSNRLARAVAISEGLYENDRFLNPPRGPLVRLKAGIKSLLATVMRKSAPMSPASSNASPEEAAIGKAAALLQSHMTASRVGRSFVIQLSVDAGDSALAGSIARAYAKVYLSDQLTAKFDAVQRSTNWLEQRLTQLRKNSQDAATAVERFRAEHGLTKAGDELVSDQQLTDLNNQLVLAQAKTADARARYQRFKAIVETGAQNAINNAAISPEQPSSGLINELKSRYFEVDKRERNIADRFGRDHPQAVLLRRQKADLQQQIYGELQQLTETYRNEYEVAQSRENALRNNVGDLQGESAIASHAQVKLRNLEQKADSLAALYQSYLERYESASQLRSLPIPKARVISEAEDPPAPSAPRKTMVLALSMALGLVAGVSMAAFKEFRDRFLRTGDDVTDVLGLHFLGYLPLVPGRRKSARKSRSDEMSPDDSKIEDLPGILRVVIDTPASAFSETLRNSRLCTDIALQDRPCKVIGFVSMLPSEGKTTVSANFAALLAAGGAKTLLIDGDLRNVGLSRILGADGSGGLAEAVAAERWLDHVRIDRRLKLAFLPSAAGAALSTVEVLSGSGIRRLIGEAREVFDYVVIDLPPLGPVIDAKAFAPLADGLIMVAEWGVTPRALVRSFLQNERQIGSRTIGLILNKTDMAQLPRYASLDGSEKYLKRYEAYYQTPDLDPTCGGNANRNPI